MITMMEFNLLHGTLLANFRPFISNRSNKIEIGNESLIITITIIMCCFTKFVEVPEPKQYVGWVVVFLFCACLFTNLGLVVQEMYRRPYLKCQNYYARYKRES